MRKPTCYFCLLTILACSGNVFGQYLVTYHTGVIKTKSGMPIMDGIRISASETMIYDSPKDLLWVEIPGKGDRQIHLSANAKKTGGIWMDILADEVNLKCKHGILYGKPGPPVLGDELSANDTINPHLLLQTRNAYHFDNSAYNHGYFFLQVKLANGRIQSTRLTSLQDSLILYANQFESYQVDTTATYKIGYADAGAAVKVVDCFPVLDTSGMMKMMIHSFVNAVALELSREEVYSRCYWLVYNATGKPCISNFDNFFDTEFRIRHLK